MKFATMRNLALLIFIFLSTTVKSQNVSSFGNAASSMVKLYHPKNEQQTDLENSTTLKKQKKKLGGFAGISFTYEMDGAKSPIRLNADSAIFVIEQGTGLLSIDMSMTLMLYKMEIKDGKRIAVVGDYKSSLIGSGKTTDTKIATSSKQLKEGLTQLMPAKQLEKGEYAFISSTMEGNNYDGKNTRYLTYSFGID